MSDRRPEKVLIAVEECRDCGGNGCSWCADTGRVRESKPSPADLLAAVRRGVESGTIKGGKVWRCVRGDGICHTATPALLAKGEFVGVHVDCGWVLVIPVSDGGEDRP